MLENKLVHLNLRVDICTRCGPIFLIDAMLSYQVGRCRVWQRAHSPDCRLVDIAFVPLKTQTFQLSYHVEMRYIVRNIGKSFFSP